MIDDEWKSCGKEKCGSGMKLLVKTVAGTILCNDIYTRSFAPHTIDKYQRFIICTGASIIYDYLKQCS